ncbi:MAG: transcription-repair coupling factor [Clostridia bacterium]|nr:transcription-repair coupling factor [Clostridia bacterium]
MEALLEPLRQLAEYEEINKKLKKRQIIEVTSCVDPQKLHLIYGLSDGFTYKIIVTFNEQKAKEICEDYKFYDKNVCFYPAKDLIFYQADIHGNLITKQRMNCLKEIMRGEPMTIVTTIDAFMEHTISVAYMKQFILTLSKGDVVDLDDLSRKLTALGYERMSQVETSGQFSIRGGIVDIFPLTEDNPVRMELWGDEIDSIRIFDVISQRSVDVTENLVIYPATETILSKEQIEAGIKRIEADAKKASKKLRDEFKTEQAHRMMELANSVKEQMLELGSGGNMEGFLDYFYEEPVSFLQYFSEEKADSMIFLDEPVRIMEKASVVEEEFRESMSNRLEKGYLLPGQMNILYSKEKIFALLSKCRVVTLATLMTKQSILKPDAKYDINVKAMNSYNNSFESLVTDLKRYRKNGFRILLLSGSRTRSKRLTQDLTDQGLLAFYTEDMDHEIESGQIMVTYGRIRQGYEYPFAKFVVISESDIFTSEKKRHKKRKTYEGQKIQSFTELTVGDYVVHEDHGLGIYQGIEQVVVDKVTKDYIKIEYRDHGNLYIPATRLDMIQKYASKDSRKPKLNKLGGTEWVKTKSRVKAAVDEIATDLVELYASRYEQNGYVYGPDTVWQTEFEELFPFEETEDQLLAIEATKRDMESSKIMDRLICGDVGYGKTEIAIRAAFKAVQEGKQVVYLVPTTILAQQHYHTFVQRMKDYPVRIELMSRFRTASEQKATAEDLKKGIVDIVIGTHRVLSADVGFKDLGLLIIDEEQRFGVKHKEKIKKLKSSVDVMTLTATPIPRTLHMSLVGIRDMSVLEEPPMDRMPIQTFVMEYNEEMVREAISRELGRGGQVFYVHNRINTIADITAVIRKLVPEATVAYAHGQMKEHELERIMYDFINQDIDVLVTTTIIETGLDISNVNTMIIHDSDQMGLSQLYQLRGRVGRSNRTAYAFLMYRRNKMLKEVAEKRLQAIREFTDLGSGFKIAMRDLEIRGAGNLLGEKQSGHMEAVGYDLYCKMLNEAVKRKKGQQTEETYLTSVDMNVDAFIPGSYIVNEYQKIDIYKRIASIENEQEKEDITEELNDRFGTIPKPVLNLLEIAYLRVLASKVFVTEIEGKDDTIKFSVYERAEYDNESIPKLLSLYHGDLVLKAVAKPYFLYHLRKRFHDDGEQMLLAAKTILTDMQKLLISTN